MNKIRRFSALAIVIALWIASSGAAFSLFAQTTPGLTQGEDQIASDQAKAEAQTKEQSEAKRAFQAQIEENTPVVKSYSLKFISASEFMRSAKFYVRDFSGTETTLTVMILRKNIPDFEALLKKLDVEKKNIRFQVYTIIASKEDLPESYQSYLKNETKEITDRDLKAVLDELKGLWNFKHYWVETPSFLMAKDGSESNHSKLVSRHDFELNLRNVQLRGEESGKRVISVGEIQLSQSNNTPNGKSMQSLIFTSNITFKEKGYLVVGVSGVQTGWSGAALILIISAEIN
jgi:hypothetical protein